MNDYDFSTLNDKEFENLVVDLISRDRNKRFERFKAGRDGGIDGRYYEEDGKEEIIQCKHYLKTGYSGLISSLKKKNNGKNEVDKVKILNPKKYIFITSLPLSVLNKEAIKELFEPYIKRDSDIYGQEDLNDLLKINSDIEENHYKLWISSTTVLQRIFNNAIKGRSEFLLDEIKDKIKYYVLTDNHNNAIKKLEESHTIIIAGEPGIGKTTLAEQIALNYIEKGFEFCVIAKDISEAEAIFERDKKQIFYFDDFLGSNYLNALERHADSHIMQFILRIKKDKEKRFILTSRTNIFNQSILLSDKFRTQKLDSDEFIITVDGLEEIDKAKILYNHLWHSNLSNEYIDELYKEERYKQIIKHRNFNPRLIEFIMDIDRINSTSTETYWQDIQNNLNNPSEIWANTFDSQSDEFIRNIILLVVFNKNTINEEELKKSYDTLNTLTKAYNNSNNSQEFDSIIEKAVKYFLNRSFDRYGNIRYSLFNPSIADFIINRYKKNEEKVLYFLQSLNNLTSLQYISSMKFISIISEETYNNIIKKLYLNIDITNLLNDKDIDYTIKVFSFIFLDSTYDLNEKIIPFCQKVITEANNFTLIEDFINILLWIDIEKIEISTYNFIRVIIMNTSKDLEEINKVIELIKYLNINDENINSSLNDLISEYLQYELEYRVDNLDTNDVSFDHDYDGVYLSEYEINVDDYLEDLISDIESFTGINVDEDEIVAYIDVNATMERLIEQYKSEVPDDYYNHREISSTYGNDEIDDLFERG